MSYTGYVYLELSGVIFSHVVFTVRSWECIPLKEVLGRYHTIARGSDRQEGVEVLG